MRLSCYVPSQIIPKNRVGYLADKQILKRHILSYPKIIVSKNPQGWGWRVSIPGPLTNLSWSTVHDQQTKQTGVEYSPHHSVLLYRIWPTDKTGRRWVFSPSFCPALQDLTNRQNGRALTIFSLSVLVYKNWPTDNKDRRCVLSLTVLFYRIWPTDKQTDVE